MIEIGVIPVAGRGLRLVPYTENTPKTLLEVGGETLLERNLDILANKVHVKKIYIIHGHLGEQVIDLLKHKTLPGVSIEFIECVNPDAGLANGLLLLKEKIHQPFAVILGDEFYLNSNHEVLLDIAARPFNAACAYLANGSVDQIKQNYSLELQGNTITSLVEKPAVVHNSNLGCGTFLFTPKIFDYIEKTAPAALSGKVELIEAINQLALTEGGVVPIPLTGMYRNINYSKDYISATHLYRKEHIREYKTSLVIPAYNEAASLGYVIDDFRKHVDEIVVAASPSQDDTVNIARSKADKVLVQTFAGYGDALKQGMNAASGDILILVEADGSFSSDDLPKFLSYLQDADMVIGTRTTKQMIQQGANMRFFLRWGNVLAAKIMQFLWLSQEPRFTDLGCTYRAIWKDCYKIIEGELHAKGPEFSPEMMVEVMKAKRKVIEIPVTYRPRMGGESKHSKNVIGILKTGTRMLSLIIRKWITPGY